MLGAFIAKEEPNSASTDVLVAMLCLWTVMDEGHILNLVVDIPFRSRGIATGLIDWAKRLAVESEPSLSFLTLEVRSENTSAIGLYTKNGFEIVGRRKKYYHHPDDDAILMSWMANAYSSS